MVPWAAQRQSYLASALGTGPDAARAAQLAVGNLLPDTSVAYSRSWTRFEAYCRARAVSSLPATTATVINYVAYLATPGNSKLQPQSLQPILSAINRAHADVGLPGPACGTLLSSVRRGWSLEVHHHDCQADQRAALPASIASRALARALALLPAPGDSVNPLSLERLRSFVYVAFGFALMARVDTDLTLQRQDVELTASTIFARLRQEKGRATASTRRRLQLPRAAVPGLYDLLRGWQQAQVISFSAARKTLLGTTSFWRLGSDTAAWTSSSAVCDPWLQAVCVSLGESPPSGDSWTTHSIRIGAASAANAIDVNLLKIKDWGGWALASGIVLRYIRTVIADQHCFQFFGWMLRPGDLHPRPQSR